MQEFRGSEASMSECLSEMGTPTPGASSPDKRLTPGSDAGGFKLAIRRKSSSQDLIAVARQADPSKRWRGQRWCLWEPSVMKPEIHAPPPTEDEIHEMIMRMSNVIRLPGAPAGETVTLPDERKCVLCPVTGDTPTEGPGRLLNIDIDKWVHLNCALWSYEVYETLNGALMNVDAAIKRGLASECALCHGKGATISCFKQRCTNVYHVACAQKEQVMFFQVRLRE